MHSLGNHWHHLIAKEQNQEELRWISMCKIRKISLLKYKSLLTMDVDVVEDQKVFSQFTVKPFCLICTTAWNCSTQNWTWLCWQTFKLSRRLKKLAKKDKEVHHTAFCNTLNPSVRRFFSTPMESASPVFRGF